ncbi:hypothetical protein [Proteus mirabilis]
MGTLEETLLSVRHIPSCLVGLMANSDLVFTCEMLLYVFKDK